jgi:hypothetical protein
MIGTAFEDARLWAAATFLALEKPRYFATQSSGVSHALADLTGFRFNWLHG